MPFFFRENRIYEWVHINYKFTFELMVMYKLWTSKTFFVSLTRVWELLIRALFSLIWHLVSQFVSGRVEYCKRKCSITTVFGPKPLITVHYRNTCNGLTPQFSILILYITSHFMLLSFLLSLFSLCFAILTFSLISLQFTIWFTLSSIFDSREGLIKVAEGWRKKLECVEVQREKPQKKPLQVWRR